MAGVQNALDTNWFHKVIVDFQGTCRKNVSICFMLMCVRMRRHRHMLEQKRCL